MALHSSLALAVNREKARLRGQTPSESTRSQPRARVHRLAVLAQDSDVEEHVDFVFSLLHGGLASDPTQFEAATREVLTEGNLDPRSRDYVVLTRALVLGPTANCALARAGSLQSATRSILASLGARTLPEETPERILRRTAEIIVSSPIVASDSRFAMLSIATAMASGGVEYWTQLFGQIEDRRALAAFAECLQDADLSSIAFGLEYLAPPGDPAVSSVCRRVLAAGKCDDDALEASVRYLASSSDADQAYLLGRVSRSEFDERTTAIILGEVAWSPGSGAIERIVDLMTRSPEQQTRVSALWALSAAQEAHLDAALRAIDRAIWAEVDGDIRNQFVYAVGKNVRQKGTRGAILTRIALGDPDSKCRKTALDALIRLDIPGARDVANQMSTLDPDPVLREYAATLSDSP